GAEAQCHQRNQAPPDGVRLVGPAYGGRGDDAHACDMTDSTAGFPTPNPDRPERSLSSARPEDTRGGGPGGPGRARPGTGRATRSGTSAQAADNRGKPQVESRTTRSAGRITGMVSPVRRRRTMA